MLYFKTWFQEPYAPSAPLSDLQLLKGIMNYKVHNSAIADIAIYNLQIEIDIIV